MRKKDSMPLNIGPGNEHDSKKIVELVEGLDWRPGQLYADAAYDMEPIRRGLESIGIALNIPVNPRNCRKPTILSYMGRWEAPWRGSSDGGNHSGG